MLKYDDGTKYTIGKFKKLCEQDRIRHPLVMEMRMCFPFEKDLSKTFWVKAINTTT